MSDVLDEMIEDFSLFDDWEDRYRYLIDLGRGLPHFSEDQKTDDFLVKGCTSRVWLHADKNADGHYEFFADSDAHIVRGLVALVLKAYNHKKAEEIAQVDIESFFSALGLEAHLSPNRRNGFFAMVERVKAYAGVR